MRHGTFPSKPLTQIRLKIVHVCMCVLFICMQNTNTNTRVAPLLLFCLSFAVLMAQRETEMIMEDTTKTLAQHQRVEHSILFGRGLWLKI